MKKNELIKKLKKELEFAKEMFHEKEKNYLTTREDYGMMSYYNGAIYGLETSIDILSK